MQQIDGWTWGMSRGGVGRHLSLGLVLFSWCLLLGCQEDAAAPDRIVEEEIGVVVNSLDVSITVFSVDEPNAPNTIGLSPAGSPVGLAVRGSLAVIPLGFVPAVAVVDLSSGILLRTIALPEGSGATGVAFLSDSLVLVANPNLNSVSRVNIVTGAVAPPITVGGFPQHVTGIDGQGVVLNAELGPDFLPEGPGTVSIISGASFTVVGTVQLSGENPSGAVVGPDSLLYVVNAGRFGAGNGSLSVVDLGSMTEVAHHTGFGEFPASPVFGVDGSLYFSSFAFGIGAWSPASSSFIRAPEDAVAPEGLGSSAGVGFDGDGRMYALRPDCVNPSAAIRLTQDFATEAVIPTGICPIALVFTHVDR